jgi:hypothetical protein
MAIVKLYTGDYPVVELTGVDNLGTEDIKSVKKASGVSVLVQGGCVLVDEVKEEASLPTAVTDKVWLHASVEKLYNGEGRNKFAVLDTTKGFLARVFRIRDGQTIETNAVEYDDTALADLTAIKSAVATGLFLIPSTTGLWTLTATLGTATTYGKVKSVVILPNGETGLELVFKA